jgi:hypothetical protein
MKHTILLQPFYSCVSCHSWLDFFFKCRPCNLIIPFPIATIEGGLVNDGVLARTAGQSVVNYVIGPFLRLKRCFWYQNDSFKDCYCALLSTKLYCCILRINLLKMSCPFKIPSQKISGGIHRNCLEPVINRKVLMGNSEPFFQISFL